MTDSPEDQATEFADFVRGRSFALLRAAYLLTGDQHLAEDLVQEALARTHRAWGRLRQTGHAEAYARRVLYHQRVTAWRRRRVPEVLVDQLPELAQETDDTLALRLALRTALQTLTAKQRAVVVLRYFEDRSEAETAELLGVSVGTVKSQCHHALRYLRERVPGLDDFHPTRGGQR